MRVEKKTEQQQQIQTYEQKQYLCVAPNKLRCKRFYAFCTNAQVCEQSSINK